jgi:hypothetical protein
MLWSPDLKMPIEPLRTGLGSTTIGTGGVGHLVERRSGTVHPLKGEVLDEPLKRLMQELGNAINDSLSESDRIAEAIGEIKRAGYDVFLVLEATIGFNRREDEDEGDEAGEPAEEIEEPKRGFETTGKIKFTTQDHRFLRALKIAVDDENR